MYIYLIKGTLGHTPCFIEAKKIQTFPPAGIGPVSSYFTSLVLGMRDHFLFLYHTTTKL